LPYDYAFDGHAAWVSLCNDFEGESYHNLIVEEAYSTLEHLH
jgi:hypothetical protein